jgi:predicted CxxxxCH...CXXCH cytochrome family protein
VKTALTVIRVIVFTLLITTVAFAVEAPHNASNNINCGDCHSAPVLDDSVCLTCHVNDTGGGYSKTNAPKVLTHSSSNTSDKYGTWSFQCKDCHNQHQNDMRLFYTEESYLVTGTITSVNNNGDGTSTFGYSNLVEQRPGWADFTLWGQKSGNERGLIFFPNFTNFNISAEVISATAGTITVQGWPGSVSVGNTFALTYDQLIDVSVVTPFGSSTPKFLEPTGPDSFAHNDGLGGDVDGDGNLDDSTARGICQICHSQTQHWRRDGSLAAIGVHSSANGVNCMQCHKHQEGFKAEGCNTCHGFPPIQNVPNDPDLGIEGLIALSASSVPATSGSVTAGSHDTHINGQGLGCGNCHNGGMLDGASQGDDQINLGFTLNSSDLGGNYDGQSVVAGGSFPYIGTSPTTVSAGDSLECSNIYCHGSTLEPDGGTDTTPVWNDPTTGQCGACHGATTADPPTRAPHEQHAGPSTNLGHDYACSLCHTDPSSDASLHVNMKSEVAFDSSDPKVQSASYDGTDAVLDTYGNCSNLYCHSNVQTSPPGGAVTYQTVNWGDGAIYGCSYCHEGPVDHFSLPVTGNTTGSHVKHGDSGIFCSSCHANDPAANPTTDCIICHTVNGPNVTHANYAIDVNFANIYGGNYSGTPTPGDAYGSCSTTYCHSTGQGATADDPVPTYSSPTWGNSASGACGSCHGIAPATGSHSVHINNAGAICDDCHIGAGNGTSYVSANHINNNIDVSNGYSLGGSPGDGYGTCSTASCHGGYVTPQWGTAGAGCNTCHSSPPATGAHVSHALTTPTVYGETTVSNFGGEQYDFGCGNCHPTDESTFHQNGSVDLSLDMNDGGPIKSMNNATDQTSGYLQTPGTSVTCNAAYCHSNGYQDNFVFQISPDWYGGAFVGDKCSNCHGNSPNSGGIVGSGSHYTTDAMGTGEIGGHFVGIHYDNIFTGSSGLEAAGNTARGSHGNAATSSTINCQTCHNDTVVVSGNDQNTICSGCHDGATAAFQGDASINAAGSTHINGQPDVVFNAAEVLSKAQLRHASIPSQWDRTVSGVGYKEDGAYDQSVNQLTTSSQYDAGTKTCAVSCHNDNPVRWGDTGVDCNSCHTGL